MRYESTKLWGDPGLTPWTMSHHSMHTTCFLPGSVPAIGKSTILLDANSVLDARLAAHNVGKNEAESNPSSSPSRIEEPTAGSATCTFSSRFCPKVGEYRLFKNHTMTPSNPARFQRRQFLGTVSGLVAGAFGANLVRADELPREHQSTRDLR